MANFDLRNQQVGTQYNAGRDIAVYQQIAPLTLTDAQHKRNRVAMLERVRTYWIKGVLEPSLFSGTLALGLHEQSDIAFESDIRYQDLHEASQHARDLPIGTPMLQVYTDADSELLILGEPGSGKTTLLLELARSLLDRAANDETHPIPVVVNLSSWALKRRPLSLWLVDELELKYLVPRKLGLSWVANDQLLPMLDGLDEVAAHHRASCIEAINTYRHEHGLVPLVVTCRSADYATLPSLQINSILTVQPLTIQQIDAYLAGAGEQMNALCLALHNDPVLQDLATTPLLLSVLMLLYQEERVEDPIHAGTPAEEHQRILANYVLHMLQQRGKQMPYQPPQVMHWLSWLARQLALRGQTEFSIERMQPDWLAEQQEQRAYERLGVRLPGVLIGMAIGPIIWIAASSIHDIGSPNSLYYIMLMALTGGLIGGLLSESSPGQRIERSLIPALVVGVFIVLIATFLYELNGAPAPVLQALSGASILGLGSFIFTILALNGLIGRVHTETAQGDVSPISARAVWSSLLKAGHLKNGVVVGLIYGLAFCLDNLLSPLPRFPTLGGLAYGLIVGISGIIISVILGSREHTIQPVELLVWSWRDFSRALANLRQILNGVLIGAILGLLCGLSAGVRAGPGFILNEGWFYAVSDGLAVGLGYWLSVAIFHGVSGAMLAEQRHSVPNQGIWLSARNGLFMGLIGVCVGAVFTFLAVMLRNLLSNSSTGITVTYLIEGLLSALIVGLAAGLIVGLLNGWLACIRHSVLRFLLSQSGAIPSNYPDFLDEIAARALLRKVGGNYLFVHHLLLEYFAAIETTPVDK